MKFLLHTESCLQSPDVLSPPQTSGPRDYPIVRYTDMCVLEIISVNVHFHFNSLSLFLSHTHTCMYMYMYMYTHSQTFHIGQGCQSSIFTEGHRYFM